TLACGERRLRAVRMLGWTTVPVLVLRTTEDQLLHLKAEREENVQRKEFTPLEMVAIGEAIEAREKEEAKRRQGRAGQERCGKFPQQEVVGKTRDKVAEALGVSGRTYEKAKAVARAAQEDPKKFGPVAEEMNRSRKIDPAFRRVREAKRGP